MHPLFSLNNIYSNDRLVKEYIIVVYWYEF